MENISQSLTQNNPQIESAVLLALEPYKVRRSGGGWRAQCPAHGGKGLNLAIAFKNGKTLFHCHSHWCSYEDIVLALRLGPPPSNLSEEKTSHENARWVEYRTFDRAGRLVATHKRTVLPDGKKDRVLGWFDSNDHPGLKGLKPNELPLYGSQRIDSFDPARPVDICEGQPATEALLGLMAQALGTYGTGNVPTKETLSWVKGFTLRLWPDNDPIENGLSKGVEHMRAFAKVALSAGAAKVILLDTRSLPIKGDAVEWLQRFDKTGRQDLIQQLKSEEVPGLPVLEVAELPRSGAVEHRMSDIKPEKVEWLFENRVPRGDVTLLVGDPGTGKSTFTIELAARVSTGRGLPGEPTREPENVVYLTWEDGLGKTVRPRLEAAGADVERVIALSGVYEGKDERGIFFPQDLGTLEASIRKHNAKLVIIDPLMAFLGTKVDSHKDQEIRRVMGGLARIGAATGAAIVIINHMNKSMGGPALYRGAGSIGIIGAARSALLFAKDPDDKGDTGLRILAPLKSNLGPPPPSIRLQVVGALNGSSMILFKGNASQTADGLTAAQVPDSERGAVDDATEVLKQILAGGRIRADDVRRQAREAGVPNRTLDRAKDRLGVKSSKSGREWFWAMPPKVGDVGDVGDVDTQVPEMSYLKNIANTQNNIANTKETVHLGGLHKPTLNDMKAANIANIANTQNNVGDVVSIDNKTTYLKIANIANIASKLEGSELNDLSLAKVVGAELVGSRAGHLGEEAPF